MDRRQFVNAGAAAPLALAASPLVVPLAARAQARPKDVLVVANEFGRQHRWPPPARW